MGMGMEMADGDASWRPFAACTFSNACNATIWNGGAHMACLPVEEWAVVRGHPSTRWHLVQAMHSNGSRSASSTFERIDHFQGLART